MALFRLVQSVQPLEQSRMRVVPAGIQMIANRETKIIQIQFDERGLGLCRMTQVLGETVSLELEAATQLSCQKRKNCVVRREDVTK
jgi:hypothetical protein